MVMFSRRLVRLAAVVENVKPVAVAGMLTEAGTGKFVELLVSVATRPPAGASAERSPTQVAVWSGISVAGVQLIDEIEAIWSDIAERDDWRAFEAKVVDIRAMGRVYGRGP